MLQGKVYEDYACNGVTGTISRAAMTKIQYAVRSRILELTLEIEKSAPSAAEVTFGSPELSQTANSEKVSQISNQVIYGNVTHITSSGAGTNISVQFAAGDLHGLIENLTQLGIASSDASEFAHVVASEESTSPDEPLGDKASTWIVKNLKKALDGTWKVGVSVATKVLTEAALKYYGLK